MGKQGPKGIGGKRRTGPRAKPTKATAKPVPAHRVTLSPAVAREIRSSARGPRGESAVRYLEEAVAALDRGRAAQAVEPARRAKALAPRAPAVREALGIALYRCERFREALSEIQAYRRLSGRADQNHLAADCRRALGEPEKALQLAREALEDERVPAEVRAEAAIVGASALADQGRIEEALAFLGRIRTGEDVGRPSDLRVWYVAGDILARAGRAKEAAEHFRRIVRFDADAYDAAERLAQLG